MFIPNSKHLLHSVLLDTPNWRATILQFWKTSNSLSISSLDITCLGLAIAGSSRTECCVPWISRIRLSTDWLQYHWKSKSKTTVSMPAKSCWNRFFRSTTNFSIFTAYSNLLYQYSSKLKSLVKRADCLTTSNSAGSY